MSTTTDGTGGRAGAGGTLGVGYDDLVTGEAVALELPPASLPIHVVSAVIDIVATLVLLWGGSIVIALWTEYADSALASAAVLTFTVVVFIGFPTTMETLTRGRTLGKLALGLRTVRDDAGPITFRHALTRALIGFVEIWMFLGVPAVVTALVSAKGKRMGDLAAGTYVVRERVRMTLPVPPQMPPQLAGWAHAADIARLPDGLALAVRQYLVRAPGLSPQARSSLGAQLHADVLQYVAPPPPAGTPTDYLLAAVIADRRRRDAERLSRDAQLRGQLMQPDPLMPPPGWPTAWQSGWTPGQPPGYAAGYPTGQVPGQVPPHAPPVTGRGPTR